MAAFNQDDARERAMVSALNLAQRPDRSRHDEDAHVDTEYAGKSVRLLFECKSTPVNSDFGTGRDTGPRQLKRWAGMHFVFGWFEARDNLPKRMWYGSPAMMRDWNTSELAYLQPDLELLGLVPDAVTSNIVTTVMGDKDQYTFEDMQTLLKDQWKMSSALGRPNLYVQNADVVASTVASERRYSRAMAELAVRDRVRYLLARGGTVNNRKIPAGYVIAHCVELVPPRWAQQLSDAIEAALSFEPPTA